MAINVTKANQQAAEIADKIGQLRNAKSSLQKYKAELQANWQGKETGLFIEGIDNTIAKIDALLGSLNNLSNNIRAAAREIDQEEKAAAQAAAARAARQQRLAQARNDYNRACETLDSIAKERAAVVAQMRNTKSMKTMAELNMLLIKIDQRLMAAQDACEMCRAALDAAGR